ncbi:hypothetical protein KFE25_007184 [Diacronema lutheri]|uniref:Nudix hydrolase domain-containing protein n=1 Tax=Diacronema lutheri TaxID=2081491 RepID=A0A8J5XTD2_DIALT|nr:hypothetical protein KFE25_007184 [Diacronema lutheri]|mmetsp:Transcript_257/g.851  ORF Transcript_257/g.851 Transcript_257/m.851 type:complete len:339 (-) Transcript_257:477-1493(-)
MVSYAFAMFLRRPRTIAGLRAMARVGMAGAAFGLSWASATAHVSAASPAAHPTLGFRADTYHGVIIEQPALADMSAAQFGEALRQSCERWSEQGKRGVWLHVPLEHSELVPAAVSNGFKYHHADEETLTLVRWLPDTPSTLPPGPAHQIGVGAFVMNGRGEVLVVRERTGPAAKHGVWKVPTGLIDRGEDLFDAVRREVLEETGVHTCVDGAQILSIRHAHPVSAGGISDVFVMISLRLDPARPDGEALRIQESEIAEARWMPLSELTALKYYAPGSMLYEMVLAAATEDQGGFCGRMVSNGSYRPGASQVYRNRARSIGSASESGANGAVAHAGAAA